MTHTEDEPANDQPPHDAFVARLLSLCNDVAGGDYDRADALFEMTADVNLPADLSAIAEAFGMMLVQVEAREFSLNETIDTLRETQRQLEEARKQLARENEELKATVAEMKVEIDHAKKDQEVAQIVESDYFQDLQVRARDMRRRVKGK